MPSEKEIEEASRWSIYRGGLDENKDGDLVYYDDYAALRDNYLSMKSERDKLEAIVDADTEVIDSLLKDAGIDYISVRSFHSDTCSILAGFTNIEKRECDCVYGKIRDALSLREKE